MSKPDTGGDAFPCCASSECKGASGMTLRDYFAAKAMLAMIQGKKDEDWDFDDIACASYTMADAMIEERD